MDGTVIKQIREDKNLTLEATYFGVCSKTNAMCRREPGNLPSRPGRTYSGWSSASGPIPWLPARPDPPWRRWSARRFPKTW